MWAVECRELSKDFTAGFWRKRTARALDRLSLAVSPGEIFGLLGHNGAGKTTTLKLLLRLIFPTSGEARLLGEPVSPRSAARIGYLPENPYFYDYLTCRELVAYYAELSGVPAGERAGRVEAALARVGMTADGGRPLRKCSKGMVQRVGLAQAIVHRPELLILDEPMSGLDPGGRAEVRDLILELRDQGATILFSTHILDDAERLCDRVAVLVKGQLRALGTMDEVAGESESVEIVFRPAAGGREHVVAPRAELWTRLEQLRAARAEVLSARPLRRRLEEMFGAPAAGEAATASEAAARARAQSGGAA